MLNKKLSPVLWLVVIVGSFALGAFTDTLYAASTSSRAQRGELPNPNNASAPSSIVFTLPREPKENIRGGLAQAYGEREPAQPVTANTLRPALHSEDRIDQVLSQRESAGTAVSTASELPLKIRGGMAEERGLNANTNLPVLPKPVYLPHSDGWTDTYLDRFDSAILRYQGIPDRPARMRGGPLDD
jgi:hypothetical protein